MADDSGLFRDSLARDQLERLMEECKASVRAKVEHLFFYVKQMFGYSKTRYRGLPKNENRLALLPWIRQFTAWGILYGMMLIG